MKCNTRMFKDNVGKKEKISIWLATSLSIWIIRNVINFNYEGDIKKVMNGIKTISCFIS